MLMGMVRGSILWPEEKYHCIDDRSLENLRLCHWLKPPGDAHDLQPCFPSSFNLISFPIFGPRLSPSFLCPPPLESLLLQLNFCPMVTPLSSPLEPPAREAKRSELLCWADATRALGVLGWNLQ